MLNINTIVLSLVTREVRNYDDKNNKALATRFSKLNKGRTRSISRPNTNSINTSRTYSKNPNDRNN